MIPFLVFLAAWLPQSGGTTASLRGVSAINARVAWASGANGTVLRTDDGGANWIRLIVPGTQNLDFRDVESRDGIVWLMSSGPGDKSRVYRTANTGKQWLLSLANPDQSGFFDAIALFSKRRGILLGDPVNGRFVIYTTADGTTWARQTGPVALPNEGAFAASGTCLVARPNGEAWFGTGAARVFHSADFGLTWTVSQTPLAHEGKAAGVFSVAFRDAKHGIAVGGDYTKPAEAVGNIAITGDGGKTWHQPKARPAGYRSAIEYRSRSQVVTTGTSGTEISHDAGETWQPLESTGYNSLSFRGKSGWAVGPQGRIAHWR